MNLGEFAREMEAPSVHPALSWRPIMVHLEPGEGTELRRRCEDGGLAVVDPIDRQLADLAAVRLPGGDATARRRLANALVDRARDRDAFGAWVWLPWDRRIVHVLDHADFFDVITSRNQDKVTLLEQVRLRACRVGVIGLSVGGEAAVTIAQEHLCGTIVLADFDRLDLSNLNRLNAGVDELGVNKAVIVARRIARIDPYLEVEILTEGVTATNASSFLDGLDLLVEECDSLELKFEIRRLARERGLNVVYAGDERGFLSVEPYGLSAGLEPFHSRIPGPHPARDAYPDALSFMRALTDWLGGWDAISERSRASIERIGESVCGYPQLASEARYAAGQVGHVARRLLLGERLAPFLGNVDLEEILPLAQPEGTP